MKRPPIKVPDYTWIPVPEKKTEKRVIDIPERTWIPVPTENYQDVRICDGLNQLRNPLDLGTGQSMSLLNFVPTEYPTLSVREGWSQLGGTKEGHYINHLRKYANTLVIGTNYGVYKRNAGSWDSIIDNASAAERYWQMVDYDGVLVMANGTDAPQTYNGSSTTALSNAPNNSRHITIHANRLFLVDDDEPNVLRWSEYENITNFTTFAQLDTDPGFQPINTNTGEDIEAIRTFRDRVLIFKQHSIHALYGELGYDFTISDIATSMGLSKSAWRTICEVNRTLFFLGNDGVFAYGGGGMPDAPISDPVKMYIDSINREHIKQCVGGTDGRNYYLTLVTGANTTPNVTLMYDPEKEKGSWWVHNLISTSYMDDVEEWYTGTTDGKVRLMGGDTDAGAAIGFEVIPRPIIIGSWHVKKRPNKFRVIADIPAGATLNVYYSPTTNGSDFTLLKTMSPTTDVVNTKIMMIGQRSEWHRFKFTGIGRVKIYAIAYEVDDES